MKELHQKNCREIQNVFISYSPPPPKIVPFTKYPAKPGRLQHNIPQKIIFACWATRAKIQPWIITSNWSLLKMWKLVCLYRLRMCLSIVHQILFKSQNWKYFGVMKCRGYLWLINWTQRNHRRYKRNVNPSGLHVTSSWEVFRMQKHEHATTLKCTYIPIYILIN